jgi:hypothetical protein
MNVLGVRCSNKDFSYAVMSGTRAAPEIIICASLDYPKNFARPKSLVWFAREINQLIEKYLGIETSPK